MFEFELRLIVLLLFPSFLSLSLSFFLFSLFSSISFLPPRSSSFFFFPSLSLSDCLSRFFCSVPSSEASRFLFLLFSLSSLSPFVFFHLPILSTVSLGSLELQIMQRTVLPPRDEFLKNYKSRVQTSASRSTRCGGFRVGRKREREREKGAEQPLLV